MGHSAFKLSPLIAAAICNLHNIKLKTLKQLEKYDCFLKCIPFKLEKSKAQYHEVKVALLKPDFKLP